MSSTPEKKATREEAIAAINAEREYQEKVCKERGYSQYQSLESELHILQEYADNARRDFVGKPGKQAILDFMRVAGAIAVRAMENHGAPTRE